MSWQSKTVSIAPSQEVLEALDMYKGTMESIRNLQNDLSAQIASFKNSRHTSVLQSKKFTAERVNTAYTNLLKELDPDKTTSFHSKAGRLSLTAIKTTSMLRPLQAVNNPGKAEMVSKEAQQIILYSYDKIQELKAELKNVNHDKKVL